MKKGQILAVVILTAAVVLSRIAFADTVSGKVASVDSAANTLTVSQADPATGAEQQVTVSVKAETAFEGVKSLADLKAGEEVMVEASQDAATGSWNATSVKASAPAAPAAQ